MMTTEERAIVAEQWLDVLLSLSREGRLQMAAQAVSVTANIEAGESCLFQDHQGLLRRHHAREKAISEALAELRQSVTEMSEAARPGVLSVINRIERLMYYYPG